MSIDGKTEDYRSHKNKYNVYVEVNSKTKVGQNLLKQYHEQANRQYIDIGRIGYHDDYGRYKIDKYTIRELKVVPKLIISVIKTAMNRAGKDVYKLRTYMSKFGQLNFLLTVDQNCSELFLVENVYICNLNHREDYETLIWKMSHQNEKPIPLKQIFYEYGIKANPDDYGKSWNEKDVQINNVIVSTAKAALTVKIANAIGSITNQKVLVSSLNNLNTAGKFGEKVTKAYREKVAKKEEINNLASSQKLENTLNQVLIKTIDKKTDKKDLKNKNNLQTYNEVVNVQFAATKEIAQEVENQCTPAKLKDFIVSTYEKNNSKAKIEDVEAKFNEEQSKFEKIIEEHSKKQVLKEQPEVIEEKFDTTKYKGKTLPNEYRNFENEKVNVNLNTDRFFKKEDRQSRKERKKEEKQERKIKKQEEKQERKEKRQSRVVEINCDIEEELEKSKIKLGIKKQREDSFSHLSKKEQKALNKQNEKKNRIMAREMQDEAKKENILTKLGNRIKRQNVKLLKKEEKEKKKKQRALEMQTRKEKKKKKQEFENQFIENRKPKEKELNSVNVRVNNQNFVPHVKPPENKEQVEAKPTLKNASLDAGQKEQNTLEQQTPEKNVLQQNLAEKPLQQPENKQNFRVQNQPEQNNSFNNQAEEKSSRQSKIEQIINRERPMPINTSAAPKKKKEEPTLEM